MSTPICFLAAAETVTGSRYLVESGGARVLVDCALYTRDDAERSLAEIRPVAFSESFDVAAGVSGSFAQDTSSGLPVSRCVRAR